MTYWYTLSVPLAGGEGYFEVCRCDSAAALGGVLAAVAPALLATHSHVRLDRILAAAVPEPSEWLPPSPLS